MSGAPADVGLYKGVIYKTNEKRKQFADIRGVFYASVCRKKEEGGGGTPAPPSKLKLLLY